MVDVESYPRKWYFSSESAIYQRLPSSPGAPTEQTIPRLYPGDHTIHIWKGEPIYRYFWNWSLPPITFCPHESLNGYSYDGLPAVWIEGHYYSGWIEVWREWITEAV
jgi:hypothetical protein